jgi:hypothetical protein
MAKSTASWRSPGHNKKGRAFGPPLNFSFGARLGALPQSKSSNKAPAEKFDGGCL